MSRRPSARTHENGVPVPPDADQANGRGKEPGWREWIQDLGRRHRRLREFLGLSQEQLARVG